MADHLADDIAKIEGLIGRQLRTDIAPEENEDEETGSERDTAGSALRAGIGWRQVATMFGAARAQEQANV